MSQEGSASGEGGGGRAKMASPENGAAQRTALRAGSTDSVTDASGGDAELNAALLELHAAWAVDVQVIRRKERASAAADLSAIAV